MININYLLFYSISGKHTSAQKYAPRCRRMMDSTPDNEKYRYRQKYRRYRHAKIFKRKGNALLFPKEHLRCAVGYFTPQLPILPDSGVYPHQALWKGKCSKPTAVKWQR